MSIPNVSVVLPVYNPGKYLAPAIGSIIDQSYQDWELICVNDGSTDQSRELLDWFAGQDKRIRVYHQENAGVVPAANRGCELARADLICRMDADDISMPNRIEHQVEFMQHNPEYAAVGGSILEIDNDSEPLGLQSLPSDHETIVARLLRRETGLFNPACIMRTDAFRRIGGFRKKYQWIEDHDLWLRMSQVGRLGNTSELVLCYRLHPSSCTWSMAQLRSDLMSELMREAHAERGIEGATREQKSPPVRSVAGPGKWARKAVRGGYPKTALKHLRKLWQEKGLGLYSLRMLAEVGLQLPSAIRQNRNRPAKMCVPNSDRWNQLHLVNQPKSI